MLGLLPTGRELAMLMRSDSVLPAGDSISSVSFSCGDAEICTRVVGSE